MTLCVRLPYQTEGVETLIKRLETYSRVSVEVLNDQIKLFGATNDLQNAQVRFYLVTWLILQNYCLKFIGPESVEAQNVSLICFQLFQIPSFLYHFEDFFKIIIHPKTNCVILIKGSRENINYMLPYLVALNEYSMAPVCALNDLKPSYLRTLCKKFRISVEELPENNKLKSSLISYLSSIVGKSCANIKCTDSVSYIEAYRRKPFNVANIPKNNRLQNDPCVDGGISSTANRLDIPSLNSERNTRRLRTIVIDGSNVAFAHSNQNNFSPGGILLAIDFFRKRGHKKVVAVVPRFRRGLFNSEFDKLERSGHLAYTPARIVNNIQQVSDDDSFILRLALENDAVIVSNDQFRDHRAEKPEFRDLIDQRLLQYTLTLDTFLVADDPLGRDGPSLSEFLSLPESTL